MSPSCTVKYLHEQICKKSNCNYSDILGHSIVTLPGDLKALSVKMFEFSHVQISRKTVLGDGDTKWYF